VKADRRVWAVKPPLTVVSVFGFLLVAALAGCERQAVESTDTAHAPPVPVASAAPMPAPAPLPCLAPDSLRDSSDTLRYSNLRVHEETGDLLGSDLQLVRRGGQWVGRIALAEGSLSEYAPTHEVSLDPASGSLTLAWDFEKRPASFHGMLTCSALIGEFRWGPDADPVGDTLPRWRERETVAPAR
jgi:hypothetical protein